MSYLLKGDFVECCDCFTVCPCWVSDLPDEDHCSGLYLWSFDEGSVIDGTDVAGMKVAAATFHAVRSGGQAMFFIDVGAVGDDTLCKQIHGLFARPNPRSDMAALAKLLGVDLGYRLATIAATFRQGSFDISVTADQQSIARAHGQDKAFTGQPRPMTLEATALNGKLGIGANAVTVQDMAQLTVDVAALPGGPLHFRGRSGMRSTFRYAYTEPPTTEKANQALDAVADSEAEA